MGLRLTCNPNELVGHYTARAPGFLGLRLQDSGSGFRHAHGTQAGAVPVRIPAKRSQGFARVWKFP